MVGIPPSSLDQPLRCHHQASSRRRRRRRRHHHFHSTKTTSISSRTDVYYISLLIFTLSFFLSRDLCCMYSPPLQTSHTDNRCAVSSRRPLPPMQRHSLRSKNHNFFVVFLLLFYIFFFVFYFVLLFYYIQRHLRFLRQHLMSLTTIRSNALFYLHPFASLFSLCTSSSSTRETTCL